MGFDYGTGATTSDVLSRHKESPAHDAYAENRQQCIQSASISNGLNMPAAKLRSDIGSSKEFKLHELATLSLNPLVRFVQRWWLQRAERHYLICADVEQQRAREAQMNVAYYQKQAALARSARH